VQVNRHQDLNVQHFVWSNYNGGGGDGKGKKVQCLAGTRVIVKAA